MILQQCFYQRGSAYPFLWPRVKTFLTYVLATAAFGQQPHLGAPWTASLLGPVPSQEQVLEEAFICLFCHYQPLQTGSALYGPSTPSQKCDPTVFSHLFPSSAGTACGQVLSLGIREVPARAVSLNPKRTAAILNVWLGNLLLEFQPDLQKNLS